MPVNDDVKCPVCAIPHSAYHQVESALLRAVELLEDPYLRDDGPAPPWEKVNSAIAQARAALRLDVPPSPAGARAAGAQADDGEDFCAVLGAVLMVIRGEEVDADMDGYLGIMEARQFRARLESVEAERDALLAFKTLVHTWLDRHGVPTDPYPEHTATTGCRIRGRMTYLLADLDRAERDALIDALIGEPGPHGLHYDALIPQKTPDNVYKVTAVTGSFPSRDQAVAAILRGVGLTPAQPVPIPAAPRKSTVHEGQALLVAVSLSGELTVLGADGAEAQLQVAEATWDLFDLEGLDEEHFPTRRGLHVWEGSITELGEVGRWAGAWRPATAADLARFGLGGTEENNG
jgi:hypothetical protein